MFKVLSTRQFADWVDGLRDDKALALIAARIDRMAHGHFGDVKPVGSGVMEARVHCGPGYRLYYTVRGRELLLMLAGGDKGSQRRDIELAIRIKSDF